MSNFREHPVRLAMENYDFLDEEDEEVPAPASQLTSQQRRQPDAVGVRVAPSFFCAAASSLSRSCGKSTCCGV